MMNKMHYRGGRATSRVKEFSNAPAGSGLGSGSEGGGAADE